MLDPATIGYELLIGAVVGFTIGLTGVGGGVLVVPALTVLLGLPATTAVGTASAYAFLTKVFAGIEHWRLKTIDTAMAHLFLAGAVPGNIAACLAIGHYKSRASDPAALAALQSHLKTFIAGVMVFATILMIANLMREWRHERRPATAADEPAATPPPIAGRRRVFGALLGVSLGTRLADRLPEGILQGAVVVLLLTAITGMLLT